MKCLDFKECTANCNLISKKRSRIPFWMQYEVRIGIVCPDLCTLCVQISAPCVQIFAPCVSRSLPPVCPDLCPLCVQISAPCVSRSCVQISSPCVFRSLPPVCPDHVSRSLPPVWPDLYHPSAPCVAIYLPPLARSLPHLALFHTGLKESLTSADPPYPQKLLSAIPCLTGR